MPVQFHSVSKTPLRSKVVPSIKLGDLETEMNWIFAHVSEELRHIHRPYKTCAKCSDGKIQVLGGQVGQGGCRDSDFPLRWRWVQISNDLTPSSFPPFWSITELEEQREKRNKAVCGRASNGKEENMEPT